jgi:hypothetical protein
VSGDPYEQLDDMTASGPVQFIFEAEQATSLVDASGRDLEFFEKNNFGELFGTIQGAAITQFVLAITKLYERPSQRYPNLSLPSVISHIAANAARLEIKEERLARLGLDRLGVDSAPLARANAPEEKTRFLANSICERLPDADSSDVLRALKTLRDKRIAHPEAIDLAKIEKTTWGEAETLLQIARTTVGIIGDAYLSTAFVDDKGSYLQSIDGARVGSALGRLIDAARKGLASR